MIRKIDKFKIPVILILIVILGAFLRLTGISWGLPSDSHPLAPLHPDEKWIMQVASMMNWGLGDFNPNMAHHEGTFAYYLWCLVAFVLKKIGILNAMPWELTGFDSNFGNLILTFRLITILLDLGSIYLVYSVIKNILKNEYVGLCGALFLAVTPFEVIHAHYARTHIVANFFLMCVIACCAKLYIREKWRDLTIVGLFCGVCCATRYPIGISIVIPMTILAMNPLYASNSSGRFYDLKSIKKLVLQFGIIGLFTLLGFFICDPYLFIDFDSAKPYLLDQARYIDKKEFGFASLLDLDKIWVYLTYLFPFGTYPYLWIIYYFSPVYLLLRPKLYRFTLPLIFFSAIYFYSMTKGYTTELIFIRPAIATFPPLAILSALALWDLIHMIGRRWFAYVVGTTTACILLASTIYTWSYVSAMSRTDPRVKLYEYLIKQRARIRKEICAFPYVRNFIVMSPAIEAITNPKINFVTREDIAENPGTCDYFIIGSYEPGQIEQADIRLNATLVAGTFKHVQTFDNPITFMGHVFSNRDYPHDLQYPFPFMYVLKRRR